MPRRKPSPIWHPITQHAVFPEMTKITRGDGAYLYKDDGTRVLDAISSWWVITHGHCHPKIAEAVRKQAGELDQVIFAGYTHDPAERVAEKLIEMTPDGLDYVFFSDSGSTSIEVALKMALGYWFHAGTPRGKVLVLDHSYHGDTIGTMSVGERSVTSDPYEPLMFSVESLPFPHQGREQDTLDALETACAANAGDVAAMIVEPLVLGAGGMFMYPAWVLAEMRKICARHDVLFIVDEVMTAWGRTGTRFACDQAEIVPDIVCYSKGLTGGFLPLAVTLCHEKIFDAFYSEDRRKLFFHSSSFMANPINCAAALANLEIWQTEPVLERVAAVSAGHESRLKTLAADGRFENIRQTGTVAALDVKVPDDGYFADIGPRLYSYFQDRNLLIRPLGNTIYLLPPYCLTPEDLDELYDAIACSVVDLGL